MVAKEPWEEKCIHRQDVVSAWVLVLIESAVVMVTFGLLASISCGPEDPSPFAAGSERISYASMTSGPADVASPPASRRHC